MEDKKQKELLKGESSDNSSEKNNINTKNINESTNNKAYLTNEEYIKLFYNSNNTGVNTNFPLNVIHNQKKAKNGK